VAEEISRSDVYKVDKLLSKNIIIMMSMSQRSINLSALGLFTYEHTNFSEVNFDSRINSLFFLTSPFTSGLLQILLVHVNFEAFLLKAGVHS
jgi:hypothetical protein